MTAGRLADRRRLRLSRERMGVSAEKHSAAGRLWSDCTPATGPWKSSLRLRRHPWRAAARGLQQRGRAAALGCSPTLSFVRRLSACLVAAAATILPGKDAARGAIVGALNSRKHPMPKSPPTPPPRAHFVERPPPIPSAHSSPSGPPPIATMSSWEGDWIRKAPAPLADSAPMAGNRSSGRRRRIMRPIGLRASG